MTRILIALLFLLSTSASAGELVVCPLPNQCVQGLYPQPSGGPFSVFLFCDDALGMNIGVINTSGAAGPGKIDLPPPKNWDRWDVNDRFWQERDWATDITSFGWSPDLKYLYVATSSVYGKGGLYKLDLIKRTYTRLLPERGKSQIAKHGYESLIISINEQTGVVTAQSTFFNASTNRTETVRAELK